MTVDDSIPIAQSEHENEMFIRLNYSKKKRLILVSMIAYSAILGVLENIFPFEGPTATVMLVLPLLVLILQWCSLDAKEHNFHIGRFLRIGLIFCCLIALPIYLFRTRGLAGVKSIVLACLFYLAIYACNVGTFYLTSVIMPEPMP